MGHLNLKVAHSEKEEAGRVALECLGELGPLSLDSPLLQVHMTNLSLNMFVFRSMINQSLAVLVQ